MICNALGYTHQGYKKHEKRLFEKHSEEIEIMKEVLKIKHQMPNIGVRKIKYMLSKEGYEIGRDRLFELLSIHGLLVPTKTRKIYTSASDYINQEYSNLLKDLSITRPNQIWVCDITYIRKELGFNYLYLVTDYYSRKILGYCLSETLESKNCLNALKKAMKNVDSSQGIIHHSDHGTQYVCNSYINFLKENGFRISLTGPNHCYDNAVAERVNNTLKNEFGLGRNFHSHKELEHSCHESVKIYNDVRPHLALNYNVPNDVYGIHIVDN